jgi:polar amino acid transport system substrate-binding protein
LPARRNHAKHRCGAIGRDISALGGEMRLRLGIFLAAVCLVFSTLAEAGEVLDRARDRGSLIAAAVPDALPLAARDSAGTLRGFDIDVAQEIAKRLGLGIEFVTPSWQEILAGGWARRWDFAVVSMTPTAEREKTLEFPAVYRMSPATLVVHKDNNSILVPREASGKTIGVKADTTFEQYLDHDLTIYKGEQPPTYLIDDPVIRVFPDKASAMAALVEGDGVKLDAVVTSLAHAQAAIAAGMPVRVVPGFLFFEPLAVATDKGYPEFDAAIDRVVDEMRDDGTLSKLSLRWFGMDLSE